MANHLVDSGRIDRLAIATDGSEYSAGAIRVGVELAGRLHCQLIGLSVALYSLDQATQLPNLADEARALADEALDAIAAAAGDRPMSRLVYDAQDPSVGIVDAAAEAGADLVVMGRRGKRGLARAMVGDATVKVIGHGRAPVLVVPRTGELWRRCILLATDGSPFSQAAAKAAGHVARIFGLPVTVVSVVVASHSAERRRLAHEAVVAEVARLREAGVEAEGRVVEGRTDEVIVATAEADGADLIVLGTHGRTGLKKILVGSIAERVIGQADCPVLVVKP
ncbi:MAG: universal stress protein [Hydrogenophilaceae bacterium]|nr:universal stress protein [Hydrogenophilaceae bacterium]